MKYSHKSRYTGCSVFYSFLNGRARKRRVNRTSGPYPPLHILRYVPNQPDLRGSTGGPGHRIGGGGSGEVCEGQGQDGR